MFEAHFTLIHNLTGKPIFCPLPKTHIQDFGEYLKFVSENLPMIHLKDVRVFGLEIKEIIKD